VRVPSPFVLFQISLENVLGSEGRWRDYDYDELIARDKASLDIFWLKDASLEDTENLPEPGVIAAEIVEDLEVALEQMRLIADDLEPSLAPNNEE